MAAIVLTAGLGAGAVLVGAPAAFAVPEPPEQSWFHDPLTPEQRDREIPVPKNPRRYDGKLRWTTAHYRTHGGDLAVPAAWAKGHLLEETQALTFDGDSLFAYKSTRTTAATRKLVKELGKSFSNVTSVRCEGYADHDGRVGREVQISRARAAAICALVKKQSGVKTRSVGYGGRHPAIVGGKTSQRDANRRVVVEVLAAIEAPSAPTLTGLVPGDESVTLTFSAPTSSGGSAVTGYQVSTDDGETWVGLDPLAGSGPYVVEVDDLVNGEPVTVRVRAGNAAGWSPASNAMTVTPVAPKPTAPTVTSVKAGLKSVQVTFAEPTVRADLVEGYELSTDGDNFDPIDPQDLGEGLYGLTLGDLTSGTLVTVWVRATYGDGQFTSSSHKSAMPFDLPGAPHIDSVEGVDGEITTVFSAPESDGGSPILGYEIDYGTGWVEADPSEDDGALVVSESGFINGDTYSVKVRAFNKGGDGEASSASSVTPIAAPDKPSLSGLVPGNGTLTAQFTLADQSLAKPVTSIQARVDDGEWETINPGAPASGVYSYVFTELTNGTTYDIAVRAVNAAGKSEASTASAKPYDVPGAPSVTSATGIDGHITISFTAPDSDGGSEITGYQIHYGEGWVPVTASPVNGVYTVDAGGFKNGDTYLVNVRAVNAGGAGAASAKAVKPITHPDAPSLTQLVAGNATLTARFTPPAFDLGKPVAGYEMRLDDGDWEPIDPGQPVNGVYSFTIAELTNGTAYDVAVRAVNDAGESQASTLTETPYTTPGAPTLTGATANGKDVTLTFTAPDSNGGRAITKYEYLQDDGDWTTLTTNGNGPLTATVANLANGTYSFKVRAVNAAGAGTPSEASSVEVEVLVSAPDAPTLNYSWYDGSYVAFSISPGSDNGSPITDYEWTYDDGETWLPVATVSGGSSTYVTANNGPWGSSGSSHPVRVRAINSEGPGPASNMALSSWL